MGGGKLVSEKSWRGKKLVHREEYIPVGVGTRYTYTWR